MPLSSNAPFSEFGQSMILRDIEQLYLSLSGAGTGSSGEGQTQDQSAQVDQDSGDSGVLPDLSGLATINYVDQVANQILDNIPVINYPISIANGGTGATTAPNARTALGLGSDATGSNLSSLTNTTTARTNLGLGSLAVLSSPLPVANGGTAATSVLAAQHSLSTWWGLGTLQYTNIIGDTSRALTAGMWSAILVGGGGGGATHATSGRGGHGGDVILIQFTLTASDTAYFQVGAGGAVDNAGEDTYLYYGSSPYYYARGGPSGLPGTTDAPRNKIPTFTYDGYPLFTAVNKLRVLNTTASSTFPITTYSDNSISTAHGAGGQGYSGAGAASAGLGGVIFFFKR